MRIIVTPIIVLLLSSAVYAQVGVRTYYQNINAPNWERLQRENSIPGEQVTYMPQSYGASIDTWFRLSDYRIEFYPEVGYLSMSSFEIDDISIQWDQWFAKLNTHFYVFDFEEDCNCPTFSKQSPWLKKGFFFALSAGGAYAQYDNPILTGDRNNNFVFTGSIGAGLDIGINDFITITPLINWAHWFTPEWSGLAESSPSDLESTHTTAVQMGLRVGFRFDQLSYY